MEAPMLTLKDYLKPALAFLLVTLPILLVDALVGRILWGWFLTPLGVAAPGSGPAGVLAVAGLLTLAWVLVGREFGAPTWEIPGDPPTKEEVRQAAHRVARRLGRELIPEREPDVVFDQDTDPAMAKALDDSYNSMLAQRAEDIRAMRVKFWGRYGVRVALSVIVLGMGFLCHLVGG